MLEMFYEMYNYLKLTPWGNVIINIVIVIILISIATEISRKNLSGRN